MHCISDYKIYQNRGVFLQLPQSDISEAGLNRTYIWYNLSKWLSCCYCFTEKLDCFTTTVLCNLIHQYVWLLHYTIVVTYNAMKHDQLPKHRLIISCYTIKLTITSSDSSLPCTVHHKPLKLYVRHLFQGNHTLANRHTPLSEIEWHTVVLIRACSTNVLRLKLMIS